MDLQLPPGPGMPAGLNIPAGELMERFSRSSGPGGQSVNTTDSKAELRFDVAGSAAFTETQRLRLLQTLAGRLIDGVLVIVASEQRSQRQNRTAARDRLAALLTEAIAPPPAPRRARRPSMASRQRRLDVKRHRSGVKAGRGRLAP